MFKTENVNMKKINITVLLIAIIFSLSISSCKKPGSDPNRQDLIKRNWKVSKVVAKSNNDSLTTYSTTSPPVLLDDYSKFQIKFDGTNYNYTDVNGNASIGTYTFGAKNATIIFKGGALDNKVYTITSLDGASFVFTFPDNSSKIPSQKTITAIPV